MGSRLVSAYAWPAFTTIGAAETVNTLQLDFWSPFVIAPVILRGALEMARELFEMNDLELAAYVLWEKEEFQVSVPPEFCLFGHCWTPPFAGETTALCYFYRVWVMSVVRPGLAAMALPLNAQPNVRPFMGVWALIGLTFLIVTVLTTVAGIAGLWTGNLTWPEIRGSVHDILTIPGENIRIATMWPMFMFGFALVAASVALPIVTAKLTVPVGQRGRVEVGAGGRAPAKKKKKRS